MELKILVLNIGSSSHKCILFEGEKILWKAHLEWKENFGDAQLSVNGNKENIEIASSKDGLTTLLKTLPKTHLDGIGHRIVHGGEAFKKTTEITKEIQEKIHSISYLAPLHNPANLEGLIITQKMFPNIRQFCVFDTAFHSTLPEKAYTYPIPYEWQQKGVRRYGFHGISHSYCSERCANLLKNEKHRIIICHLGSGASLCAVKDGKSIDTTMGMTPLEGLMMASRSGTIDPGIIFHLTHHEKVEMQRLDTMLNKESGLLGISGISDDMRDVISACETHQRADLALNMFIYRLYCYIGMMIAALEGLDAIVFTAGIGENIPVIREKACIPFRFMGLHIDPEKNKSLSKEEREISTDNSKIKAFVIPTREEWKIAKEVSQNLVNNRSD